MSTARIVTWTALAALLMSAPLAAHHGSAAFDVGKAINPDQVRTQMEGGVVQAASSAIFEQLQLLFHFLFVTLMQCL